MMISVRETRGMIPVATSKPSLAGGSGRSKSKPSRLEALQADLQSKIQRDKEKRLMQVDSGTSKPQKPSTDLRQREFDRNESLSAPGGVRSFFKERKSKLGYANSAGQLHSYQTKKKEGYDKSHPLQPITHNTQNSNRLPPRGKSDPTLINSNKQAEKKPTDFEKWRMEQDTLDRQRRLNSLNNKNGAHDPAPEFKARMDEYQYEAAELRQMKEQEEIERQALAAQRQEEERERKALLKEKQEEKRRHQAERGRRRKEESERRQREAAEELQRRNEADQYERDEQAELIHKLEEQLKEKQKDLEEIKQKKPRDSPEYNSYEQQRDSRLQSHVSPEPHVNNRSRKRDPANKNSRQDHQHSRTTPQDNESGYAPPTKPKKVHRKDVNFKLDIRDVESASLPTKALNSPAKSSTKSKPHALNTTYKVSRENSIPIDNKSPAELAPFIVDGEGLDIKLVPCGVCGRQFAEDRVEKHQKVCKKSKKPRKQFNTTSQRIAGSGAETFQHKHKQAQNTKKPAKNWRAEHEQFISAIRYAKQAAAIEAKGGDVSELAPPPKSENPDYVQCPHCQRRYNQTAAERHIPKCKDIRAKPKMLKKGGRR